jgi:hypothetical protein
MGEVTAGAVFDDTEGWSSKFRSQSSTADKFIPVDKPSFKLTNLQGINSHKAQKGR